MKKCITERVFNRYIDDSLKGEELIKIKSHIEECAQCRAQFKEWDILKVSLPCADANKIPADFKSKVMTRIIKINKIAEGETANKKGIIFASLAVILVALYYFLPLLFPEVQVISKELIFYASQLLYNLLIFIGLDLKTVMDIFKALMTNVGDLFLVFSLSTLILIVSFFSLFLRQRAKIKSN